MYADFHNQFAAVVGQVSIPFPKSGYATDADVAEWLRAYHEVAAPEFELESIAGAIRDGSAPSVGIIACLRSKHRCADGCGMHLMFVLEKQSHQRITARFSVGTEYGYCSERLNRVTAIMASNVMVSTVPEEGAFDTPETEEIQNFCLAETWLEAYAQLPSGLQKPLSISQVFTRRLESDEWWEDEGEYYDEFYFRNNPEERKEGVYPVAALNGAFLLVRDTRDGLDGFVYIMDSSDFPPLTWAYRKGYVSNDDQDD